jgi:hypothetical protein
MRTVTRMNELSPARQALLARALDVQERMLAGCGVVFSEFRQSSDPDVVFTSERALEALKNARDILEAMIDGLNATYH